MKRITVDVDDDRLEAARAALDTDTAAETIDAALRFVLRKRAMEIIAMLDSVEMDHTGSEKAWRYGGGRELSRLEEAAREELAREREDIPGKAEAS
jgi:hypothetical protein